MAHRGCPLFYYFCFYTKTPVPAILTLKRYIYFPIYRLVQITIVCNLHFLEKGDCHETKHQKKA